MKIKIPVIAGGVIAAFLLGTLAISMGIVPTRTPTGKVTGSEFEMPPPPFEPVGYLECPKEIATTCFPPFTADWRCPWYVNDPSEALVPQCVSANGQTEKIAKTKAWLQCQKQFITTRKEVRAKLKEMKKSCIQNEECQYSFDFTQKIREYRCHLTEGDGACHKENGKITCSACWQFGVTAYCGPDV